MNIEKKQNKLIIISSPSGAGKTTICKYLLKKMKDVELSISYTTRQIRANEFHKKDYFFINKDKFLKLKNNDFFIESAKVFNNYYGSPYSNIDKAFKRNNNIIFDIDWQGAKKLRKNFNKNQIIDFFILPPSKQELRKRLEKRGRDNKAEINIRLSHAITEMSHHIDYEYVLINENINETVYNLLRIIDYNVLVGNIRTKINKKLKFLK
jgi:guanylate kinase